MKSRKIKKHKIIIFLLLTIPIAYYILFKLVIIPYAFYISLTDRALIGPKARKWNFIGLENYIKLMRDPEFHSSLKNSLIYAIVCGVLGQLWLGLLLSQLIWHGKLHGKLREKLTTFLYVLAVLTWIMPETVAAFEIRAMLGRGKGMLNVILESLGLRPVDWFNLGNTWLGVPIMLWALILANIWKGCTFSMTVSLAAMEGIPQELYDAAKIDGASWWQQFIYITIPMLKHLFPFMILVLFSGSFTHFTFLYVLMGGGAPEAGLWREANVAIYAYSVAFAYYLVGYGTAISVIVMLIYTVLGILIQRFRR